MDVLDDEKVVEPQDNKPTIDELLNNGYDWSFSRFWEKSMEIFKETFGWVALYVLILVAAGYVIGLIPGVSVVWSFIGPALYFGILIHGAAVIRNQKPDFSDFFKIFERIGPIIGFRVIISIITL
ncbi:MAG: hypothetical protein AAF193_06440, partial [Bacteroidota bacterium]